MLWILKLNLSFVRHEMITDLVKFTSVYKHHTIFIIDTLFTTKADSFFLQAKTNI